ncbi:hypothetical protein AVEN_179229-1 [Araneus ventricosus]|uniref:CCHC-type domain-containing protein n=1 Tax=Araneus ventricosus TaxID=182803 RepID=A0A4Y2C8C7_ARAVE|nr:hypothetical protein AVEN_179229-1 [Araneus ventricosus]
MPPIQESKFSSDVYGINMMHYFTSILIERVRQQVDVNLAVLLWKEFVECQLLQTLHYSTICQAITQAYGAYLAYVKEVQEAWDMLESSPHPNSTLCILQMLYDFSINFPNGTSHFIAGLRQYMQEVKNRGHLAQEFHQELQAIASELQGKVESIYKRIYKELNLVETRKESISVKPYVFHCNSNLKSHSKSCAFSAVCKNGTLETNDVNSDCNGEQSFRHGVVIGPCFRCKRYGHVVRNCRAKFRHARSKKNKNPEGNGISHDENKIANDNNALQGETKVKQICNSIDKFSWIIDTAATAHFCNNISLFTEFTKVENSSMTLAVDGAESSIEGVGIVKFYIKQREAEKCVILTNVRYSPKLSRNLLSGTILEQMGANFVGTNGKIHIYDNNWEKVLYATRMDNLYVLKPKYRASESISFNSNTDDMDKIRELLPELGDVFEGYPANYELTSGDKALDCQKICLW